MPIVPPASQAKDLRHAAIDVLMRASTMAGQRVYGNPAEAFRHFLEQEDDSEEVLPVIAVFTLDETARLIQEAPREYLSSVELICELLMPQMVSSVLADQADEFELQVRSAILEREFLEGNSSRTIFQSRRQLIQTEGERVVHTIELRFIADLIWKVDDADGDVGPLSMIDMKTHFPELGEDATDPHRTEDQIDLT